MQSFPISIDLYCLHGSIIKRPTDNTTSTTSGQTDTTSGQTSTTSEHHSSQREIILLSWYYVERGGTNMNYTNKAVIFITMDIFS